MNKKRVIQQLGLLLVFTTLTCQLFARTYTSVKSGNYTDAATWSISMAPPLSLADTDAIYVMSGHTLTLDADITIGTNAAIHIMSNAALAQQGSRYIHAHHAFIEALGDMIIDSLSCTGNTTIETGTGSTTSLRLSTADSLYCHGINPLTVKQSFYFIGKINATNILVDTNATIFMQGGTCVYPAVANLILPAKYHVVYDSTGADVYTGQELWGDSLGNVTVDLRSNYNLILSSSLHLQDTLFHKSGHIDPIGTVTIAFTGSADYIHTSGLFIGSYLTRDTTTLILNTTHPLTSPLSFPEPFSSQDFNLKELIINAVGNTIDYKTNGSFNIGAISFINGRLDINSHIFAGQITGHDSLRYIVTERGGVLNRIIDTVSKTYPIGLYNHYMPVTMSTRNSMNNYFFEGIGVKGGVYDYPWVISGALPLVNATWWLDYTTEYDLYTIELTWPVQLEKNGFNRNSCYMSRGSLSYYGYNQSILSTKYWTWHKPQQAAQLSNRTYSITRDGLPGTRYGGFALAVFDENTLTINNTITKETITLYPNPVSDVLHIGNLTQSAQVTIYNTTGAAVITQKVDKNQNTISTASLPAGIYFLLLKGEGVDASGRIIKQ